MNEGNEYIAEGHTRAFLSSISEKNNFLSTGMGTNNFSLENSKVFCDKLSDKTKIKIIQLRQMKK